MARAFLQLVAPGGAPGAMPGGIRFGPFSGPIRIGTDPARSQIALDPTSGCHPEQVVVTLYATGVFGVEPRTPGGTWLAVRGQAQLWPLTTPVQVNPGDALVFGSPSGPRFELQVEAEPRSAPAPSAPSGSPRPGLAQPGFGGAIGREIARQSEARMLGRPGPIREAYYLWQRLSNGSLTSPYVIVSVLFAILAALSAGTVSCGGLFSAIWWKLMHH